MDSQYLNHFEIAERWASGKGNKFLALKEFEQRLIDAVQAGELKAVLMARCAGGFEELPLHRLNDARDGWIKDTSDGCIKGTYIELRIKRSDFFSWMKEPLNEKLADWLKPVIDKFEDSHKIIPEDLTDALGLDEIFIRINDSGRYDSVGFLNITLRIETLINDGYYPVEGYKESLSRFGLNTIRPINERRKEPMLSRQTVKRIFEYLKIESFKDSDSISKWLNSQGMTKVTPNDIKATPKVSDKFAKFNGLRPNEISIVMLNDHMAKVVIRMTNINVTREDLGLSDGQWRLLESSCCNDGDVSQHLKNLNKSNDREKENSKSKTLISRTRTALKISMGLKDNPIPYTKKYGWNFAFKLMQHKDILDTNVTKSSDAMDYTIPGQEKHLNKEDY